MKEYAVITTRREFIVEAKNFEEAIHRAGNVLRKERLITITDTSQSEINYTDGVVKVTR